LPPFIVLSESANTLDHKVADVGPCGNKQPPLVLIHGRSTNHLPPIQSVAAIARFWQCAARAQMEMRLGWRFRLEENTVIPPALQFFRGRPLPLSSWEPLLRNDWGFGTAASCH